MDLRCSITHPIEFSVGMYTNGFSFEFRSLDAFSSSIRLYEQSSPLWSANSFFNTGKAFLLMVSLKKSEMYGLSRIIIFIFNHPRPDSSVLIIHSCFSVGLFSFVLKVVKAAVFRPDQEIRDSVFVPVNYGRAGCVSGQPEVAKGTAIPEQPWNSLQYRRSVRDPRLNCWPGCPVSRLRSSRQK